MIKYLIHFFIFLITLCHGQTWINQGKIENEFAIYYVGTSHPMDERNRALDVALLKALGNAGLEKDRIIINKQLNRKTSEISVNNSSHLTDIFEHAISASNKTILDKITILEEYYDGEIGYVLIRIPKPGFETFDFQSWNEKQNRNRKLGGGLRSLALPGWGQFYQKKKIRGTFGIIGFLGSFAFVLSSASEYNKAITNMNNSILGEDKNRFYDESENFKNSYYTSIGLTTGFYLWSVLDSQLFPGEWQDYYYKRNFSPSKLRNQNKYYRTLVLSKGFNSPIQVEINNSFGDIKDFTTINSSSITLELYKLIGIAYIPAFYISSYQTPSNILSIYEWGMAIHYPTGKKGILRLYPSMAIDMGSMSISQDWDGKDDLINNYDLGYGFLDKKISNSQFSAKIEGGLHRWFGKIDLFLHLGYQLPMTFKKYELKAYDGGTNDSGNKTHDRIRILSEDLPYPSITVGGLYFSVGVSYGVEPKFNLISNVTT